MSAEALVMMLISWGVILAVAGYCLWRLERDR